MLNESQIPVSTLDFAGMAQLRAQAGRTPNADTAREAAGQFESLFIQMMLKSMRDAMPESDLMGSEQMDMYTEMHDQQLAMEISRNGGLGLSNLIEAQLQTRGLQATQASAPAVDTLINEDTGQS